LDARVELSLQDVALVEEENEGDFVEQFRLADVSP